MLVGQVPDAAGLFFAVDTDGSGPDATSATGLHHTLCGARRRCVMERLERAWVAAPELAVGYANPSACGSAAATCRILAETRASEEATERLLCGLWWSGRLGASVLPLSAVDAATAALKSWRFSLPELPELIGLDVTGFPPVVVTIVTGSDGGALCLGTAARDSWAAATRASVREAMQMKLGLDVIRYRIAQGRRPKSREMSILHRAGGLRRRDIQPLMPREAEGAEQPEITLSRQLWSEPKQNVWLAQCWVRMTTDPGPPVTGPWSRFALWT